MLIHSHLQPLRAGTHASSDFTVKVLVALDGRDAHAARTVLAANLAVIELVLKSAEPLMRDGGGVIGTSSAPDVQTKVRQRAAVHVLFACIMGREAPWACCAAAADAQLSPCTCTHSSTQPFSNKTTPHTQAPSCAHVSKHGPLFARCMLAAALGFGSPRAPHVCAAMAALEQHGRAAASDEADCLATLKALAHLSTHAMTGAGERAHWEPVLILFSAFLCNAMRPAV